MPPELTFPDDLPFADFVASATRGYDFPIALDLAFGHLDPSSTLPNGVLAELAVSEPSGAEPGSSAGVRLALLEPAVTE